MSRTSRKQAGLEDISSSEQLINVINQVDGNFSGSDLMQSTAKGLTYSLLETLGSVVGDPDLPSHLRSGYEGAIDFSREVEARIESIG